MLQFEKILEAYRRASKYWCPTLNKFAEGAGWPSGLPASVQQLRIVAVIDRSRPRLPAAVRMRGRKRSMCG